jgi:5-methylthioadenosine/S-adenosylhomocysteine deaminase
MRGGPGATSFAFGLICALVLATAALASPRQQGVDLIVRGDFVVTIDGDQPVIENGAVAVDDGRIIAVGPSVEILRDYRSAVVIPGRNRVLMPGLINGHTHAAMTLFRGVADDLSLDDWLNDFIFPLEAEFVDADFVQLGTELACWEMIRSGITTFVDMYFYPDAAA